MHFTEKNSPTWFIWLGMLTFIWMGAASTKILFSDLRPQPDVHTEVNIKQDIDRRTDCKFSFNNRCGGQD